jgi:hypothetical protein
MLSHILMTRFNVKSKPNNNTNSVTPSWLNERVALFEKYCLSSINCQTIKPDVWIILFDKDTPQETRIYADNWKNKFNFIVPVYLEYFDSSIAAILVNTYKNTDSEWLLTTRLDNDDALHPHFFELLRNNVIKDQTEFLNIPQGLIAANGKFYRKSDRSNPFISYSESARNPSTVWIDQHHLLSRHAPIRQLNLRDGWIQVIHGNNIANKIRGIRAPISSLDRSYLPSVLLKNLDSEPFTEIIFDNTFGLIRRYSGSLFRFLRTKYRDFNNKS